MDNTTLEKLHYYEIKEIVKGYCISGLGKSLIDKLEPSTNIKVVERRLNETSAKGSTVFIEPDSVGRYSSELSVLEAEEAVIDYQIRLLMLSEKQKKWTQSIHMYRQK